MKQMPDDANVYLWLSAGGRQQALNQGDRTLATLKWKGWFSQAAHGEFPPHGAWTFDRPRWFSSDIEVHSADSNRLVAVMRFRWTGAGEIELMSGRRYGWRPTNFWQTRWALTDSAENVVIEFENRSGFFKQRLAMSYGPRALPEADRALLALLGRYALALKEADDASAAATMVAVS